MLRTLAFLGVVGIVGCGSGKSPAPPAGELIGRVEVSPGVPASSCLVLLEGTPLAARCDETGEFDVKQVPPGRWNLRIVTDGAAAALPAKRIAAGSNPGQVTDLGAVPLAQPGSIGGHVVSSAGQDLSLAIIAVPEIGAVTSPNANGGYLLDAVSPGAHDVVLLTDAGTVVRQNVAVQPAKITIGADLDISMLTPGNVTLNGFATRADAGGLAQAGIAIDLVEDLDGRTIASAVSAANGAFSIAATPGTYILRAHDGSNPITAIVPSLVLHGAAPITLSAALTIPPSDGDLDGNGIANAVDPDIDGDGVPNAMDAFPFDPAESMDSDGDGVGDRADLRSLGGAGVDHKNPTPDTDGDGKLDFEDNCPTVANADQKDSDGDGIGDVCDDCPFVANPDQKDSVGNGTGDACRSCKTNQDCPGGKLCSFGQCVGCISNAQCGDEVCSKATGSCAPCATSSDCTAPQKCNALLRCVDCIGNGDCPAGKACVNGGCFPQCSSDASCPGGFCVGGACAMCRSNGDCPGTEWCDAGQCKPQCTVDGDCTGGRTCDPMTRTCVLPCSGTCMSGQTCVSNVCRFACDASHPCAAGFKCAAGACVPECANDTDCLSVRPFTVCQAGACVSNGTCAFDSDCPTTQLCLTGTCSPRTGTFVAGKGYTCSAPCDCRQGETCSVNSGDGMKYCTVDVTPTWFVAAGTCTGTTCDGKTPSGWSNNLTTILAGAHAGDGIAVHAGDSFAGPLTIAQPGIALAGGFTMCTPNRWVRDATLRSTVTGQLSIPGTSATALPNVTVENLDINVASGANLNVLDASYAHGLTLAQLTVADNSGGSTVTFDGVSCSNCNNVSFSDVSMPGFSSNNKVAVVNLAHGSGTLERIHSGPVTAALFTTVAVSDTTGALTVDGTQADGTIDGNGTNGGGVLVTNGSGGAVIVTNSQISFGLATVGGVGGTNWYGIWVQGAPSFTVSNNIIDGRGLTDPGSGTWTEKDGIRIENSSGTVDGNNVYYPILQTVATTYGYRILGPQATVTFSNNTSSLGSTNHAFTNLDVENVSAGAITVSKCNLAANVSAGATGFYWTGNSVNFAITDTTFATGAGSGGNATGVWIVNGVGRLERCKVSTAGSRGIVEAFYCANSQVELYDSYFYGGGSVGGSGGSGSWGWYIDNGSSVYGANDTIDGGGSTGDSYPSAGVQCQNSTAIMTNTLINGGSSPADHRLYSTSAGQCFTPANWSHNYLWYSSSTAPDGNDLAPALNNTNGNIVAANVTCYDGVNYVQPDYHIGASSPCVDQGAAATRKDGSTMTVDLDGNMRTQGAATDIGCHEVK